MRMHAQTAMIENGFVHLPKEAGWRAEYLHELTVFPGGKHDDQVDVAKELRQRRAGRETKQRRSFTTLPAATKLFGAKILKFLVRVSRESGLTF
jgi:hypothetical protein